MKKTCEDIRREYIEFFEKRGHSFVPSSALLPAEDPTLLFTNAGMNQFKDIFLGREKRDYVRAVNTQKCIRAGGKHNDLEDVGHDCYHHTFFEMLGNWSFGDYFKTEAIDWAWELLTKVWGLPADRLHATYFSGSEEEGLKPDTQARDLWLKHLPAERVHAGSRKDNFWEMGETGPCGPCSEIHIDRTEDGSGGKLINAGNPLVIELWNLVFMQFNRDADGKLTPLPATHVDTGMGFERICAVMNKKKSNYATDLFVPIIEKIETLTDHRYGAASGLKDRFDSLSTDNLGDVACRVIADHARTLTFAITDGVIPSNEGRGYVLRRILRRAARYGRQYLNIKGPFLVKLVDTVVGVMGGFFGELKERKEYVIETIASEEESFGKTLDRGIDLFDKQAEKLAAAGEKKLPGDVAFDLYATYGFPVDLTQIMAAECGLEVDLDGYNEAMAAHRELSSATGTFKAADIPDLPPTDSSAKYNCEPIEATVLGWVQEGEFITTGELKAGDEAAIVLDCTNFYAEQGGQVGDTGHLAGPDGQFAVSDSQLAGPAVLHFGSVASGTIRPGQKVTAEVSSLRMDTMRNHTATHLLNWALRGVLGDHINQAGSIVSPDRLRFDFTHNKAVTPEQLAEVERLVNERILADEQVRAEIRPLAEAKKIPGVRAVFGEKYPDPVRVVSTGGGETAAVEFCGGTHLQRSGQVGLFKIISEESIAKGVRRITALTGREAVKYVAQMDATIKGITTALRAPAEELVDRVVAMQKEIKQLRKGKSSAPAAAGGFQPLADMQCPQGKVIVARLDEADAAAMRNLCDQQRQKGAAALFIGGVCDGKVMLVAMVSDEAVKDGQLKAGQWVKEVAPIVGGGGGGRDNLAQAGGKDPSKLDEALAAAAEYARKRL